MRHRFPRKSRFLCYSRSQLMPVDSRRYGVQASSRMQRAFTLVELLAVVAIIGILIALLLPAIQAAREAARRVSCTNNLVQLVMAVHQYEAAHQVYPPGTVDASGPIANRLKGYHHGWIEQMLPFLEAEAVYHHIDRDVSVYHRRNMPVRRIRVSLLLCPSNAQWGDAYSHYAALHHDVEAPIDVDQNGVFFLNSAVTQDEVSDGTGYTIFLGEKMLEPGDLGWLSGTRAILRNTGEPINTSMVEMKRAGGRWSIRDQPPGVIAETDGSAGSGSMGGMEDAPEAMYGADGFGQGDGGMYMSAIEDGSSVLAGTTPRVVATFVGGFSSYHPGGANFAVGDGSIRFLANTMAMSVYQNMGHRADGELVNLE